MSLALGSVSLVGTAVGDTGTFNFGGVPGLGATAQTGQATVRIINGSLLTLQISFSLSGTSYILGAGATADYAISPSQSSLSYQVLAAQGTISGAALFGVWYAPGEPVEPMISGALSGSINVAQATEVYQSGETPPNYLVSASPIGLAPAPYVWIKDNGSVQFGLFSVDTSGNIILTGSDTTMGAVKFEKTSTAGYFTDLLVELITGNTTAKEWHLTYNGLDGSLFFWSYTDNKFPVIMLTDGSVELGHMAVTVSTAGVITAKAPIKLASGNQETGQWGAGCQCTATSQVANAGVNFKTVMTNIPSSVTLTTTNSNVLGSAAAGNYTIYGFRVSCTSNAAGQMFGYGTYVTVGNCLLAVDTAGQTFDHHCDVCDMRRSGIPFGEVQIAPADMQSMGYVCTACGSSEWWNTALTAADEQDSTPQSDTTRGVMATRIRMLQAALGLPLA